jgi:hypothetical protein
MGKEQMNRMVSKDSKSRAAKLPTRPGSGRLFFLDLSDGRVLSVNPDGSNLKTIVSEGRKLPDGIVVDVMAGHIYWTNMGNPSVNDGSIDRADLDGGNVTNIIPSGGTFTPMGDLGLWGWVATALHSSLQGPSTNVE